MRPHLRIWPLLKHLYASFTVIERRLFLAFGCAAVVAIAGLTQLKASNQFVDQPAVGGTYHEGVVADSLHDLEPSIQALTHIGLVQVIQEGLVRPALATKWEITDNGQTFQLTIDDRFVVDDIIQTVRNQSTNGYWQDAELTKIDDHTLRFHIAKPWAGFLNELAEPIFPYGPYRLNEKQSKDNQNILVFDVNEYALTKPYLASVELHRYDDARAMERAFRKGTIDAGFSTDQELHPPSNWSVTHPALTREFVLFINQRTEQLAQKEVRQHLVSNQPFEQPQTFRLAVADLASSMTIIDELEADWATMNVSLEVESYPLLTLMKTVIPERNYDLLLLGVDYGSDHDLYPYWHSSQIASPGRNFAGYRNKEVDKLLDGTRTELDPSVRQAAYEKVRQLLTEDATFISYGSPTVTFARSRKIHGEIPESLVSSTSRWATITDWYQRVQRVKKTT